MTIEEIRENVQIGKYRFSDHAIKRMLKRSIDRSEIVDVIMSGEIIEDYPDDKYSPSFLIYGKTQEGRDIHVQISSPPFCVVITIYEPDPNEWIEYKIRR